MNYYQQYLFNPSPFNQRIIAKSEIQNYIEARKDLYNNLILYLENSENDYDDDEYLKEIDMNLQQQQEDPESFEHFLNLIICITNNHHRNDFFLRKVYKIIEFYHEPIIEAFLNSEIFHIFKSNKLVLLYLIENNIVTIDESICIELMNKRETNGTGYYHFFYPEIEKCLGESRAEIIKDELLAMDPNIFDNFNDKRHKGENTSYICHLIRNDLVEEFVSYVNRASISLSSKIKPSIFETNSLLIEKEPTLIEYAAFFGSIQIFQFLRMSEANMDRSLWFYVIHSRNAELIHLIESLNINPPEYEYERCFIEAIKCHHNEFAEYIRENLLKDQNEYSSNYKLREKIFSNILKSHNYSYFPCKFPNNYEIFYICKFYYNTLADLFMKQLMKYDDNIYCTGAIYRNLLRNNKINNSFYSKNDNIRQVVIPYTIQSIGCHAFYQCKKLKELVISSSVISIEKYAFSKCTKLKKVTIPPSVVSIGNSAFASCSSLKQVIIPSSVTSIGNGAFSRCTSLKKISIPSSVIMFGEEIFNELTSLEIIGDIETYPRIFFEKSTKLEKISISSSVTSIENNAFAGCSSLKKVEMSKSLISIGEKAFIGCSLLEEIKIPPTVAKIGNYAFSGCSSLKKIVIPSFITAIGNYVFSGCSSLEEIELPSSLVSIGNNSFSNCSSVKEITIPESVMSIGNNAFYNCSSLMQITIPASVSSIGSGAFSKCSSLTKISILSSITFIDHYIFAECSSLRHIKIPPSVVSIGNNSFYRCSSLDQLEIPSSVISIGSDAFKECSSLSQLIIPSSVNLIGGNPFQGCTSLKI